MSKTWIVAMLGCALVLASCGGGSSSSSPTKTPAIVTPAPTLAPQPTATAIPVRVPAVPAAFADYAPAIAAYLSANPAAAAGPNCLADLIAAWKMPLIAPGAGCTSANTDDDPENEVVAVLTNSVATPGSDTQFEIVVFDRQSGGFNVAYASPPENAVPYGSALPIKPLLAAGDLNKDGGGELAYATASCGASACQEAVHILKGTVTGYIALTPPDGIVMDYAESTPPPGAALSALLGTDATFEDTDGDGRQELLITGGVMGSVGAGPLRAHTETWAWDGASYALRSTEFAKPSYLYQAVKDADALFAAGTYAGAEAAYSALVGNTELQIWNDQKNERNELESYSLFRAGLAVLLAGGNPTTASGYFARARSYQPQTLHDQLAASFKAAYDAKGSIRVACSAVRDDIDANLAEYQAFWDFGYGNPAFDAAAICPF